MGPSFTVFCTFVSSTICIIKNLEKQRSVFLRYELKTVFCSYGRPEVLIFDDCWDAKDLHHNECAHEQQPAANIETSYCVQGLGHSFLHQVGRSPTQWILRFCWHCWNFPWNCSMIAVLHNTVWTHLCLNPCSVLRFCLLLHAGSYAYSNVRTYTYNKFLKKGAIRNEEKVKYRREL